MRKTNIKTTMRVLGVLMALILLLSGMSVIGVSAASGGSGTKNDPYLLKTAKDVDNIRNDLDAHYKLAANIDMSSLGVFEPIGCFEAFTGTLTCDLGSNGLPKYAISNLKVYNSIGEDFGYDFAVPNYAGYGEEGVHYYASLFGKTEGATIKNIFLFDVDITNTVVGQHQGVGGYDTGVQQNCAKQVNDQGTAALITFANNTTISGCGATGKINAKTNATAGLVSRLENGSSLLNSWADMQINGYGLWYQSGLVGTADDSSIDGCMAKGTIFAPNNKPHASKGIGSSGTGAAGLVSRINEGTVVTNSYSEVTFKSGSVVGIGKGGGSVGSFYCQGEGVIKDCYTVATIEGGSAPTVGTDNANNCWVLNTAGVQQNDFKGGSAVDIKAAFTGKEGWDTSGDMPKLTALVYITKGGTLVGDSEGTTQPTSSGTASESTNTSSDTAVDNTVNTESTGDTTEETVVDSSAQQTENVPVVYIVLFASLAAITVAISAFSCVLLLKTYKRATSPEEYLEEADEE